MWNAFHIQHCIVFAYVIMPDHLHAMFRTTKTTVSEVMRSIKTNASRDVNRYLRSHTLHSRGPGTSAMTGRGCAATSVMGGMGKNPARAIGTFQWQSSFYDHVITDDRDFRNHVEYIRYNPMKAGLCLTPEEYPFLYVDEEAIVRILAGG